MTNITKKCLIVRMKLNEMWYFLLKKQKLWIWLVFNSSTYNTTNGKVSSRSKKALQKLWSCTSEIDCHLYATDHWKMYQKVHTKKKHVNLKSYRHLVKSFNKKIQHYLAHFHKRPLLFKCSDIVQKSLLVLYKEELLCTND